MMKAILCETQMEVWEVADKLSTYQYQWLAWGELGEGLMPVRDWMPIYFTGPFDFVVDTVELRAYYCQRNVTNDLVNEGMEAILASDYLEDYIR